MKEERRRIIFSLRFEGQRERIFWVMRKKNETKYNGGKSKQKKSRKK
jgi:hypothetical protein